MRVVGVVCGFSCIFVFSCSQPFDALCGLSRFVAMSFTWPDPSPPLVDASGQVPSWLQLRFRDDWPASDWYCTLCSMWADVGHLNGQKHKNKVFHISDVELSVRDSSGCPPSWLVMKEWPDGGGTSWYCELCNAFADSSHLDSSKHMSKATW